jgi:hypothetical protein
MLISSRAGETIWVSLAANDSNTSANAIRLINRYSKINRIFYVESESAIYVEAVGWANNICAHLLSNVNGNYIPSIESASSIPDGAIQIPITSFGVSSDSTEIGSPSFSLKTYGKEDQRPEYNNKEIALLNDINLAVKDKITEAKAQELINAAVGGQSTETWTFIVNNETITKNVVVKKS